jgi:hypothetical protein
MAIHTAGYGDSFGHEVSDMRGIGHVLNQWSAQVLRQNQDMLVFSRFLSLAPPGITMGKQKGETFRIPIFDWIEDTAGTTALSSGTVIPLLDQATNAVTGTLAEYGRGIGLENLLEYYTKIDNGREVVETLANNRALILNELTRSVIDNTTHNMVCGSAATLGTARFNVSGAATNTAATALDSVMVKAAYDHLKGARVPTFPNGLYVMIGDASSFRELKDEGVFAEYSYRNNTSFGLNGLIYQVLGNWEGFTFVQTEEGMNQGTLQYVYAVAPNVGAQAFAKPISLYFYPDINSDAGRLNVIKWHMVAGFVPTLRETGTRALKIYHA